MAEAERRAAPAAKPAAKGGDAGEAEVQERFDEANEQGYFGEVTDPTPNENYSLQTPPDAPTPETDEGLAKEVVAKLTENQGLKS